MQHTHTIANSPATPRAENRSGGVSLARLFQTDRSGTQTMLRLVLAGVLFPHGAQHVLGWFGGYGLAGTVAAMNETLGIPVPIATFGMLVEFLAPIALVIGFGGRIAALGLAGVMAVAAQTHASTGFFMNWFGTLPAGAEGFEYHLLAIAIALTVAVRGSGALSVDRWIARRIRSKE